MQSENGVSKWRGGNNQWQIGKRKRNGVSVEAINNRAAIEAMSALKRQRYQ
jgi:hypothetical protein